MKRLLMLFVCLILLTGCEANIKYKFGENIESTISASFNINDYKTFANNNYGNDFGNQEDSVLRQSIERSRSTINAFINNGSTFYNPISYSNANGIYNGSYKYTYTYSNFKDNYFLNACFDNFLVQEDSGAYYFKISGNSTCAGAKLTISTDNRMINNNSTNVKNDEYSWNIKESNNDIYFAISKIPMSDSSINTLYIFL